MNNLVQLAIQQKFKIVLQSNETRFRQATNDLKAWGLRQNKPPDAPFVILPLDGVTITESYICSIWAETKLPLGFVRQGKLFNNMPTKEVQDWYKKLQGKKMLTSSSHNNFKQFLTNNDDFDEDDEIPVKFIIEKDKIGKFSGCKTIETPSSSASSVTNKTLDSNENSRDPFDDTSRDSVSIPINPPTQNVTKRRLRKRSAQNYASGPQSKKSKVEKLSIPSPEDSSNDDETSSRSTLDLIIPPPKDFQGSNNPFNPVYVPQVSSVADKEGASNDQKTVTNKKLSKAQSDGKVRIVRTIRRRLSAKDIIIGPNQEVKYKRKSKHNRDDVEVRILFECVVSTGAENAAK